MQFDDTSRRVIGCALQVHRTLGPGLLESAYADCLAYELTAESLPYARQQAITLHYRGAVLGDGFIADFVVAKQLIVEIKAVDRLSTVHRAQLLTYLKLTGIRVGLLINFNVELLKAGLVRIVL